MSTYNVKVLLNWFLIWINLNLTELRLPVIPIAVVIPVIVPIVFLEPASLFVVPLSAVGIRSSIIHFNDVFFSSQV